MKKKLVLASRKSDLARIQSYTVGEALRRLDPSLQIDYQFSSSLGDRRMDLDLRVMEDKGVFTQDLHNQIIKGHIDIAVHSWKDLPIQLPKGTQVVATLPREDMRDLLLIPKKYVDKVKKQGHLELLSSSPRREYNLKSFIPRVWPHELSGVTFKTVRGNIPTRLKKLFSGEGQALILAKAALDRLLSVEHEEFLEVRESIRRFVIDSQWMVLPLCENPCAPAQGALAIETNENFPKELLKELNCDFTYQCAFEEREILSNYGGGCHQKIGVSYLLRDYGKILSLRGLTHKGETLNQWKLLRKNSKGFYQNPTEKLCLENYHSQQINHCDPRTTQWFERELLPLENTQFDRPLWIAKEMALPKGFSL